MSDQLAEKNRPSNAGDDSNLPPNVRAVAGLRSPAVAWSTTEYRQGCFHLCCSTCAIACVITCFPLFFYIAILPKHCRSIYWILTETELKIVHICTTNHFVHKIKLSGDSVHTIPLDNIAACGVKPTNWYRFLPHIYVEVSETIENEFRKIDSIKTTVGPALAGQDWLAQEILHRRDTLQATGGTANGTVSIALPSSNKHSLSARFGTMDNAPDKLLQWAAQQGQCRIVAWTTVDPPKMHEICLHILLQAFALCYMVFGVSVLSSPMIVYMLERYVNGHTLLPLLAPLLIGFIFPWILVAWVNCRFDALKDNYWVITETDLCVLRKWHPRFSFERKIPLLSISRCIVTAKGHGWLDRRDASFPSVFVGTTGKSNVEFAIRGFALVESMWFVQQVLEQRDAMRSLQAEVEVLV
jgi:hypothetical protein